MWAYANCQQYDAIQASIDAAFLMRPSKWKVEVNICVWVISVWAYMSISARWEQCIEKSRTLWFYTLYIQVKKVLAKLSKEKPNVKVYVKLMFRHVGSPSGNDGSTQIALIPST